MIPRDGHLRKNQTCHLSDDIGRYCHGRDGPVSLVLADVLTSAIGSSKGTALETTEGVSHSYQELESASRRLASQLVAAGVGVGDRVSYQVKKSPAVVVLHLALLRCGAVQIPINPDYPDSEVRRLLDDADPVVAVRDPDCPDVAGSWQGLTLDASGAGSLTDLPQSDASLPTLSEDDGAAILFTSGTTGRPKGALLSHANLAHNALTLVRAWEFTADDHLVHVLPLFHTHGLFVALHCSLVSGATMTLLPRFDVDRTLDVIDAGRATVLMGVPTHYARLLESPRLSRDVTARMRLFISGSAPMTPTLHEAFAARTGHQVLERYGMTETSMLTSNPVKGERKPGSVGMPLPGVGVRVTGSDYTDGVGSIEVQGPNVFGGYWRRPELREEAFTADGWFRTGDLGRRDDEGYLHLVGRSKELIISGGLNVYPADVESVLDALPGVRESAVLGLPDDDLGERVVAAVVSDSGGDDFDAEALRGLARQQLAGYQVPKAMIEVAELPRNAMGKVQKSELRKAWERL